MTDHSDPSHSPNQSPSHEHGHSGSTAPTEAQAWKNDGVRVIPCDQLDGNVPSTPGMDRKAAINFARVGAQKLWAGTVHILSLIHI